MKRAYVFVIAAIVLSLAVLLAPSAMAQDEVRVIKPNSVAYGRTYSDWSAAWWQWAMSIPVSSHPIFDNGDCSVGQSGPVWFLGGKACVMNGPCPNPPWTRYCTVPLGKALYFPIINVEQSQPEEPNWGCGNTLPPLVPGTIAEMRACVANYLTGTSGLEADIDGHLIRNLEPNFHIQAVAYEVTWPDDNWLTSQGEGPFPAGTYGPAIDEGWYVMLAPLPAGKHTLHFHGVFPWGAFEDMTYYLTIAK